jgi:hypothetical protein
VDRRERNRFCVGERTFKKRQWLKEPHSGRRRDCEASTRVEDHSASPRAGAAGEQPPTGSKASGGGLWRPWVRRNLIGRIQFTRHRGSRSREQRLQRLGRRNARLVQERSLGGVDHAELATVAAIPSAPAHGAGVALAQRTSRVPRDADLREFFFGGKGDDLPEGPGTPAARSTVSDPERP